MARNDLARPRARFRLREDGSLETGTCSRCSGETYRVDEGTWLHWSTLGEACTNQPPLERPSKGQGGQSLARVDWTPRRGVWLGLVYPVRTGGLVGNGWHADELLADGMWRD